MKKKDEIKVCLVGSSGGHLTHLYMLKPFWKDKNRFWVTFDKEDQRRKNHCTDFESGPDKAAGRDGQEEKEAGERERSM